MNFLNIFLNLKSKHIIKGAITQIKQGKFVTQTWPTVLHGWMCCFKKQRLRSLLLKKRLSVCSKKKLPIKDKHGYILQN